MLASRAKRKISASRVRLTPKQKKIALMAVGAIFGVMILGQLVYPVDRALPFASVGGVAVGGKTTQEVREVVVGMEATTELEIYGHDRVLLKEKADLLGVDIDEEQVSNQVTDYPWWLRLVPTSFLWAGPKIQEVSG